MTNTFIHKKKTGKQIMTDSEFHSCVSNIATNITGAHKTAADPAEMVPAHHHHPHHCPPHAGTAALA